jgi:hypothetical protein
MIAFRIWQTEKGTQAGSDEMSSYTGGRLDFIMHVMVESALLYTSTSVFVFVAVVTRSQVSYIANVLVC